VTGIYGFFENFENFDNLLATGEEWNLALPFLTCWQKDMNITHY
jgi:hypothetical protein